MNHKLPLILAFFMAIMVVALYAWNNSLDSQPISVVEGKLADVPESLRPTAATYAPPTNIYLPTMMFLVVDDTDSKPVARCKNMAFRTVDKFSRRVNSNLVRADKKLYHLAGIAYDQCMDVMIATLKDRM